MSKFEPFFFTIRIVLLLIPSTYSEILKVQDATHIYCIDDDDNDSTLFISPPLQKMQSNSDLLKDVVWDNDDWSLKSSTEIPIAPVTDKRWEDFTMVNTNYHRFNILNSKSISVFSPAIIEVFAYNHEKPGIFKVFNLKNQSAVWNHFSVISKNGRLLFYENDKVVINETDFGVTDLLFRSRNFTYWKVHEYNFRWSNTVTKDNPTIIKVPATGKSCLVLYTLLCNDCMLKIIVNNKTKTVHSGYKKNFWQTNKIEIKPNRENDISIYRERYSNVNGYWAIDFKTCDSHNFASYKIPTEKTKRNYTCSRLSNHHHHHQKYTTKLTNKVKSLCDSRKINGKCQFSCDEVFGQKHPLCRKHPFCKNSSWGEYSLECQEQCRDGIWGPDCSKKCEKGCTKCNKHDGKCYKKPQKNFSFVWTPMGIITSEAIV